MVDLDDAGLDAFEALMDEADDELYLWISGAAPIPVQHADTIARLREFHKIG